MILGDRDSSFELVLAQVETELPAYGAGGDVLVIARVRCPGFSGETDAWIPRQAWQHFLRQLSELEFTRRGEAILESVVDPGELRCRMFAVDRAGHMAVEGFVGVRGGQHELHLTFSPIAFDPTMLPRLVAELGSGAPAG